MVNYIIYMSKATAFMSVEQLEILLDTSRRWNNDHHITGMLLYIESDLLNHHGGRFIQVLEGEEEEIRGIFSKIQLDKRHYNVVQLNEGTSEKRNFECWDMGFRTMSHTDYKNTPGFFELNDNFLKQQKLQQINVPMTFLRSFYNMNLVDKTRV